MLPSKKIFVGASALLTGALLQVLLSFVLSRNIEKLSYSGSKASAMELDQQMEALHSQASLGLNAMTLSLVFILCGAALLLAGVYQTAKSVEWLLTAQTRRDG
jgi:HAMP domain-containing protein